MQHRAVHASASAIAAAFLTVAGCHSKPPTVVIGYAFPYGVTPVVREVRSEIAALGTGHGPAIAIVYDSTMAGDLPDVEVKRAQQLAALPGMVAVVGHGGSRGSLVAAPVYNDAGVVQLTPYATSRLLWRAGPWTFNLAPNDSVEGGFIADFVADRLRARRVTIYYQNDEYGFGLRAGIAAELDRHAVGLVDQVKIDIRGDFATLVDASLRRGVPDVVIVAGRQRETGTIARLMREHRVPRAVVAGDGAFQMPMLAEAAGPAADSVYAVTFWTPDAPDSASRRFVADFRRIVGHAPQSSDAMSRDALMLLVQAVREVGPSRVAVRRYLEDLGRGHAPFPGVTGPIQFGPSARPRLQMVRLTGGTAVTVVAR